MKLRAHKLFLPRVLLAWAISSGLAWAGGGMGNIVFDPSNYAENLRTAISTLHQESMQIDAAMRQVQMLEDSIKNTANTVTGLDGIGTLGQSLQSLQSQWNIDSTLMSQLGGQQQFVSNVMAQYGALGNTGSFTDYVQSLARASQLGQANATSLIDNYTNMTSELQKTMAQRAAIAAKNTGALGTNDAIQVTNASLDNLAEINQATLEGISTLVRQNALQAADKAGQDNAGSAVLDSYYQNVQTDASKASQTSPQAQPILGY